MSFRFHSFNKNKNNFSATNFLSNIREKIITFRNKELNLNTIRSIQSTNNIGFNKQIKKKILEYNLEEEFSQKDDNNIQNLIQNILPSMLTFNCYLPDENKINNNERAINDIECSNIISCFQLLIKYLFEEQEKGKIENKLLEGDLSKLKDLENLLNNNEIVPKNNEKIKKLINKKMKLQLLLKKNGKNVGIKTTPKFYICDVCPFPYKKFYSYQELHKHYVRNHINPYLSLKSEYKFINKGFDKFYFDNKMENLEEEVINIFKNARSHDKVKKENNSKEKKTFLSVDNKMYGIRRNRRYETVGPNINKNSISLKISKENEKMKEYVQKRIENFKLNQEKFERDFTNQIESFMKEFKDELLKIKKNQNK